MGMENGAYFLGCCWLLMALLFVGGVMNLYWIAGLSILVLLEILLPWGNLFSRLTGVALLAAVAVITLPYRPARAIPRDQKPDPPLPPPRRTARARPENDRTSPPARPRSVSWKYPRLRFQISYCTFDLMAHGIELSAAIRVSRVQTLRHTRQAAQPHGQPLQQLPQHIKRGLGQTRFARHVCPLSGQEI